MFPYTFFFFFIGVDTAYVVIAKKSYYKKISIKNTDILLLIFTIKNTKKFLTEKYLLHK